MNKKEEALTIESILTNDKYLVPIYQRNYEWEKEQISKLIEDINSISDNEKYYLGTLVTFHRNDDKYELIDGQQRHTTLNLIKSFLSGKNIDFNLEFQSRPECEFFIKSLSINGFEKLYENEKSINLYRGIQIIKDIFQEMGIDKNTFSNKFFNQTFLFRTELPKDTDLNHYFEIMNNRGEQLEKHEILKAQLMDVLKEDPKKGNAFSKIWDACSYMGDYVWNNFAKDDALKIFNLDFEKITLDIFESVENKNKVKSSDDNKNTIEDILKNHAIPVNFSQEEQEKSDKYRSVVDFSTFLLYVYHILSTEKNTSFDDKKLLEVFKDYSDSEIFIIELLKTRIYFDKYIVKNDLSNENESKWGIRNFEISNNEIKTKETAFDGSDIEDKIEMLQAMFYYSSISNDKKEWLLHLLKERPQTDREIYQNLKKDFKENIKGIDLNDLKYPEVSTKIFYYFEYMLWEFYIDEVQRKEIESVENLLFKKVSIKKNEFNKFRFRQLNSKEHLLSQNKFHTFKEQLNLKDKYLDSFANLCLISSSENSSASNDNHSEKKDRFGKSEISLKRLMMFESFKDNDWNTLAMEEHLSDMQYLLDLNLIKDLDNLFFEKFNKKIPTEFNFEWNNNIIKYYISEDDDDKLYLGIQLNPSPKIEKNNSEFNQIIDILKNEFINNKSDSNDYWNIWFYLSDKCTLTNKKIKDLTKEEEIDFYNNINHEVNIVFDEFSVILNRFKSLLNIIS